MDAINYQEPIPAECKCKLPLMELTSWTPTNPCRRFLKTSVKKCKKFYWYDPELDNAWYIGHLYGMYGQLNPHQIQDITNELTIHEQLIILQDEFAGLQAEIAQTQKNARITELRESVQSNNWEDVLVLYCWRAKEYDLKVARMTNKLCVKLSAAIQEHRMFTQKLEASSRWVIIKQNTSEFLQELAERDNERV
uniref:Zinc finger, GRF-type n=1 Tax=Tanacetum cinerariifolium TaxID=118510 RepID=A0A6L2JSI4_TANCI|nr:hypothetical protein [Tanacetum cinerariifolium]